MPELDERNLTKFSALAKAIELITMLGKKVRSFVLLILLLLFIKTIIIIYNIESESYKCSWGPDRGHLFIYYLIYLFNMNKVRIYIYDY
jgi:hypothetical protein